MALSPMMKHYLETKDKYRDCILFYRLGDFYEMFFDDALKASDILDITLTGRDCGLAEKAPMCGVPYHAAEEYIARLVEHGEKVAVCEQLSDPKESKGIVDRDVVRIVTAGTLISENQLDEKFNNFIACVYFGAGGAALSWADITTGEFRVGFYDSASFKELTDNLLKIAPAEIICNEEAHKYLSASPIFKHRALPAPGLYDEREFGEINALNTVKEQFKVSTLAAFGLEDNKPAVCSSGALLSYLKETQKHALKNISKIQLEKSCDYMLLDSSVVRNLELVKSLRDGKKYGTLLWLLDKTNTAMGARKLYGWIIKPLQNSGEINRRLDGVSELFANTLIRQGLGELLKSIRDISRISGKISNGNVTPLDCLNLTASLQVLPSVKFQLGGMTSDVLKYLERKIDDLSDVEKLISAAIDENASAAVKDGGFIRSGYNAQLDELRGISKDGVRYIRELEKKEKEETGIKNLKIGYNRVFGYYIEVTNSYKELVPYDYHRKQTLANAERYVTEELKQLEEKIIGAEEKSLKLEQHIFEGVKDVLLKNLERMQDTAEAIAELDCLVSFASVSKDNNYVRPIIVDADRPLDIVGGRHPVVEKVSSEQFVANDTLLDGGENRTMIITGPNMAGKSTYMRQVALITVMAHLGCFVPAKSAEIPLTDKIFTRVGASDNLIFDQSTFMVEMTEVAAILLNSTAHSLLILDEVGRGTSTFDGLSIAWAVVEYINEKIRAKTLFATHYHELTELEEIMEGVKNYKITVRELAGTVVFLRKIMRGGANKSFGIEVAALAGIPSDVTDRAKTILKKLEKSDIINKKEVAKQESAAADARPVNEIMNILSETDMDKLTPLQAFGLLHDLTEKAKV